MLHVASSGGWGTVAEIALRHYNVNWEVFDVLFEIRAANAIYRFFFFLPFPVITASNENVKTR